MTEPFWSFTNFEYKVFVRSKCNRWQITVLDRDVNPYLPPEIETPSRTIGRFFLHYYAYSTPAGVAYRLAYGVPKP